jgi:3-oxoacyl-[acyl-carrier protein] reductase
MLPPAYHDAAVNSSLFKRVGRGDDISAVVAFLAREDARWVTGQNIVASGGVSFGL